MQHVKTAYVENVISRSADGIVQDLRFAVRIDNIAFEKVVEIQWCGEDGDWHINPATFHHMLPSGQELWTAHIHCALTPEQGVPGNIRFAVRLEAQGLTFWDSNHGHNYSVDADAGAVVYSQEWLQHLHHDPVLHGGKSTLDIDTAVRASVDAHAVRVHWTTDHWKTSTITPATRAVDHWAKTCRAAARNPNRYDWEIWRAPLPVEQAYRIEYAIECQSRQGAFWDDNQGSNYRSSRGTLRVLTLNLHCNQEKDQAKKLKKIARVIEQDEIDIVCLQEVAEDWNDGKGDWATNTAHIINQHLSMPYHLHTDFSHRGFDQYREGLAILSRHEFSFTDSGYVSESTDIFDIHARRVLMAQIFVPYYGPINVFSAHLSWPEDGFSQQFERLSEWVNNRQEPHLAATLICGDFNIRADSAAYAAVVQAGDFQDQYLKVQRPDLYGQIFGIKKPAPEKTLHGDGRIDFIWMHRQSNLNALAGRELFTKETYGRVSDHSGYMVEFEPL